MGGWTYVRVANIYSEIGTSLASRGLIHIITQVGSYEWRTFLISFGEQSHFTAIDTKVRKLEKIIEDDNIKYSFRFRD